MQDAWRAYLELALGLTEASKKKAQEAARKLVGQSGATAAQLQGVAEDLLSTGLANREALVKIIRFEVDRALGVVGLATADEVADLNTRVSDLQQKLRAAEERLAASAGSPRPPSGEPGQAAPVAAGQAQPPAGETPAAKKAVAKKAVAKKAVAKKAVAKKAVAKKAVAKKAVAKKAVAKKAVATKAVAGKAAPGKELMKQTSGGKAVARKSSAGPPAAGQPEGGREPDSAQSAAGRRTDPGTKRVRARKLPPPPAQKAAGKATVKKATGARKPAGERPDERTGPA